MIKYKLSSEFVIFENYNAQKKPASLIVMHDTTFSDHTTVSMWKLMNSVWHRKWFVWHMNTDHKYHI